jgi:hypothetical protein
LSELSELMPHERAVLSKPGPRMAPSKTDGSSRCKRRPSDLLEVWLG